MKKITLLSIVCICLAALSGCATNDVKKLEMDIFSDANEYYSKGKFEASRKYYERLLNEFPDSPFTMHAILGQADCYYMEKEYVLAEPVYSRYIELYPVTPQTAHALFYKGMSNFKEIKTVPRTQTFSKSAMDTFQEFIEKYPKHFATPFAKEKIAYINDLLAQKELYIIEFYYRIDSFASVIGRVDDFRLRYPKTKYIPRALLLKGKSYLEEESFGKASKVFEELAKKYPGDPSSIEAQKLYRQLASR